MDDKKKKPTNGHEKDWELLIIFLAVLALIYGGFLYFSHVSSTGSNVFDRIGYYSSFIPYYVVSFFAKLMILGVFVAITFAILSVVWWIKYQEELAKTKEVLKVSTSEKLLEEEGGAFTLKWQEVLKYANSGIENDWVRAIISADVILGDLLDGMSLPGDTIGDKLKAVEKGDFQTLDNAWEAHKIRNAIAHSGLDFQINQREVKRIIALYETVFKEFGII